MSQLLFSYRICRECCSKIFVVSDLIVPAILGLDFLQQHGLVLDFFSNVVLVYPKEKQTDVEYQETRRIVEEAQSSKPHIGLIAAILCWGYNAVYGRLVCNGSIYLFLAILLRSQCCNLFCEFLDLSFQARHFRIF